MCWKEEWAYAIRDIDKAIVHVEKARKKLAKRRARAQSWLQKQSQDQKHNQPKQLAQIQEVISKGVLAEHRCDYLIETLRMKQRLLRGFIEAYGFSRKPGGSARVRKILQETFGKEAES